MPLWPANLLLPVVAIALLAGCGGGSSSNQPAQTIESAAANVAPVYDPNSLSGRVIPNTDLPPEGTRSLFDHLVAQNGQLPYPFENVVDWIASLDASGKRPTTVLVPHGRSLQKGRSGFDDPRVILTADITAPDSAATHQPVYKGRLFLGFVDNAEEIEVLSYNEAAGRYEFQLVKDYCKGCTPRIVYAQRNVCLACHQNAAAIFPVRPWEETNAQTPIAERIVQALPSRDRYAGAPLKVKLEAPETIDNTTDISNGIPLGQRVWLDGCGDGEAGQACRRLMLAEMLVFSVNPGGYDPESERAAALQAMWANHWPARGIPLPDNNLKNRNPLDDDLYRGGTLAALKRAVFGRSEPAVVKNGKLAAFDALPSLPQEFDPLAARPPLRWISASEMDGVYALAQLFSPGQVALLEAQAAYKPGVLVTAASTLDLPPAPFRPSRITDALLLAMGASSTPSHWGMDVAMMSPPIFEGEPELELAEGSDLQHFETYCFACHRGNPNASLNFMGGATEAEVLARIEATDSIRDVLDYERYLGSKKAATLMPPVGSWQREALDIARAEAAESGNPGPTQQMQQQVPSLFDF